MTQNDARHISAALTAVATSTMHSELDNEFRRWRVEFWACAIATVIIGLLAGWALIYDDTWQNFGLLAFAFVAFIFYLYLLLKSGVSLIWHACNINRSLDEVARAFDNVQKGEGPKT